MTAVQDHKVVLYVPGYAGGSQELSVTEVMENDGEVCGPEWGWITLGEIATHGYGIDTAPERWESLGDLAEVAEGMRAYWKAHPEMASGGEYNAPPTA